MAIFRYTWRVPGTSIAHIRPILSSSSLAHSSQIDLFEHLFAQIPDGPGKFIGVDNLWLSQKNMSTRKHIVMWCAYIYIHIYIYIYTYIYIPCKLCWRDAGRSASKMQESFGSHKWTGTVSILARSEYPKDEIVLCKSLSAFCT